VRQVNKVQVRRSQVRVIGVEAGSGIVLLLTQYLIYYCYTCVLTGVEAGSGIVKLRLGEGVGGAFYY
jgi:hypothetical protein